MFSFGVWSAARPRVSERIEHLLHEQIWSEIGARFGEVSKACRCPACRHIAGTSELFGRTLVSSPQRQSVRTQSKQAKRRAPLLLALSFGRCRARYGRSNSSLDPFVCHRLIRIRCDRRCDTASRRDRKPHPSVVRFTVNQKLDTEVAVRRV